MEGEQPTIASSELETPAIETPATTTPEPVDEPTRILDPEEVSQEQDGEPQEPEFETTEIEWDDGKKYVIPKAIEGGILKNKDYTQGKQKLADLRRDVEAREADATKRLEATEAELDARAEMRSVSAQLAEYAQLSAQDWQYHMQQDPLGTQQAKLQYDMLRDRKAELEGTLSKATKERTEKAQQGLAKRVQETLSEAPKIIPGWSPETADKTIRELVTFAQSEGIPDQVLQDNWSPQLLKLLHRAHLGHNLLTKQATAPKPTVVPPQPLQTVGGKSSPMNRSDLASADMETYVALRKRGVGGKGR